MNIKNNKLLVITGLSGAGMSSALKNIEDLNYEVFDNFPLALVEPLLQDPHRTDFPIAIGIDTRTRGFSPEAVLTVVEQVGATLLFITADNSILQKRFTQTRRRHPMAHDRSVEDGIKKERGFLQNLRNRADLIIDTTNLSIHDLRRILEGHFKKKNQDKLTVTLLSFGFRWGLPREADIVMDVRFLQNPYWIEELQSLNGNHPAVGTYINQDENLQPFINRFKEMAGPLLPRYVHEGKSYLTIAFGCTGGRHRSVFLIETLKPWLEEQGFFSHVLHRDIER